MGSSDEAIKALIKIMEASDDPADKKKAKALKLMLEEKPTPPPPPSNKERCPSCLWIEKHHYPYDMVTPHSNPDKSRYVCHFG